MSLKSTIKTIAERFTHTHIVKRPCRGIDLFQDIALSLPTFEMQTMFDVGANVGQSAVVFLKEFPTASIHCFEPVDATHERLKRALAGNPRAHCFRLALGSAKGQGLMVMPGTSDVSYLQSSTSETLPGGNNKESVAVDTIDSFCDARRISHISYLKIDTEGGDLEVLKGAVAMLSEQRIDFVQVEAGMNPNNRQFVPFETLKKHLEAKDYLLFGVYEQRHEFVTGEAHLRRCNPTFISRTLVERYRDSG